MANTIANKLYEIVTKTGSPIDASHDFVNVLVKQQPERAGYILAQAALAEGCGTSGQRGYFGRVALSQLQNPDLQTPLSQELGDLVEGLVDKTSRPHELSFGSAFINDRIIEERIATSPFASLVLSMVVDHGFRGVDG